jgi:uncharacterized membrane protein YkgB
MARASLAPPWVGLLIGKVLARMGLVGGSLITATSLVSASSAIRTPAIKNRMFTWSLARDVLYIRETKLYADVRVPM